MHVCKKLALWESVDLGKSAETSLDQGFSEARIPVIQDSDCCMFGGLAWF